MLSLHASARMNHSQKSPGLRVIRADGARLSFRRATARYFLKYIITPLVPLLIGYLMAAFTARKRALHVGAAIGEHVIAHDEVYYVLSGDGEVVSDGKRAALKAGMATYLYSGANVGIKQLGSEPLVLIIAYPLPPNAAR